MIELTEEEKKEQLKLISHYEISKEFNEVVDYFIQKSEDSLEEVKNILVDRKIWIWDFKVNKSEIDYYLLESTILDEFLKEVKNSWWDWSEILIEFLEDRKEILEERAIKWVSTNSIRSFLKSDWIFYEWFLYNDLDFIKIKMFIYERDLKDFIKIIKMNLEKVQPVIEEEPLYNQISKD